MGNLDQIWFVLSIFWVLIFCSIFQEMNRLLNTISLRLKLLVGLSLVIASNFVHAQDTYLPLGSLSNAIIDRMEIKSGEINQGYFHSSNKNYKRGNMVAYALAYDTSLLSKQDMANRQYLLNENIEWSQSKAEKPKHPSTRFYKEKSALFSVLDSQFNLVINPVLYFQVSNNHQQGKRYSYINNRGIEMRGTLGHNIGFYSQISDEILEPTTWTLKQYQTDTFLPYVNFYSRNTNNAFNYYRANAYINVKVNPFIDIQFGHTRNFIGDGYRSFILGDNQPEYLNLRLNTHFWKVNYTNIFAELRDYPSSMAWGRNPQPRHYMAAHHLSMNVLKNLNIGVFECILFKRDSGYINNTFDVNYLNPIIFYKSVENGLNSVDKAIIGLHAKWNIKRKASLYGQFVLSEFVLNDLLAGTGSFANKYAYQIGAKIIDMAKVNNLDFQAELNVSRPYMYTSYTTNQSYANFRQSLGHPLGANFWEGIALIKYQTSAKLFLQTKCVFSVQGLDTNNSNWGSNILKSYINRNTERYGNYIGQGVQVQNLLLEFCATWMPKHQLFIDFTIGKRQSQAPLDWFNENSAYGTICIRYQFSKRTDDF